MTEVLSRQFAIYKFYKLKISFAILFYSKKVKYF